MKKILLIILIFLSIPGCNNNKNDLIKIGVTLPLTGDVASYGISAKNGIELCANQINKEGGIKGKKLEMIYQDDKGESSEAAKIMNSFVSINDVVAVIGSAGSSVTLAITPIANKNHIVLISPISSSKKLTTEGGPYFFRTCPSDDQQAKILAEWINKEGYKSVGILYTNNDWGSSLAADFKSYFEKLGGKIVTYEASNEGAKDFRTQLLKIKKQKPDAIFSPTYPKEGGLVVRQAKELGIKVQLFGADNWEAPEFINIAGNAANGVLFTAPSAYKGKEYLDFENKYKIRYDTIPNVFSAYAYDALEALVLAIKNSKTINKVEIERNLKDVKFQGVSNFIEFDNNGNLKTNSFSKNEIINGKIQ